MSHSIIAFSIFIANIVRFPTALGIQMSIIDEFLLKWQLGQTVLKHLPSDICRMIDCIAFYFGELFSFQSMHFV